MNLEAAHIFFPKKFLNSKGFLIGFNISGFLITVIHVQETSDVYFKFQRLFYENDLKIKKS